MQFTTRTDAHTFVANSGVANWEWQPGASAEGFAGWLWDYYGEVNDEDLDQYVAEYLHSLGQNPADYGVSRYATQTVEEDNPEDHYVPIVTAYEAKPIPSRNCDWTAMRDDNDKICGYGSTEVEAVNDLLSQEEQASK